MTILSPEGRILVDRGKVSHLKVFGVVSIATPVLAFAFIALSIDTYPQFNWVNNALSDLGVVFGITALLFNFGLCTSGLLTLILAFGLYRFLNRNVIGKMGALAFAAAGAALEGVGLAPENYRPFHYIFSVAFFTLIPIALLLVAAYFISARQNLLGAFTLSIAAVAAVPWVLYFIIRYVSGVAIPEMISAFAASTWAIAIGWEMYKAGTAGSKISLQP